MTQNINIKKEDARIVSVVVKGLVKDMETICVNDFKAAQSALRAVSAFYRHNDYNVVASEVGFHVYAKHTSIKPYMERYAIVNVGYQGDKISPEWLRLEAANHPLQWIELDWMNNSPIAKAIHPWGNPDKIVDVNERSKYFLSLKKAKQRQMKHNWIDTLLCGYGIEIVVHEQWERYAQTVLEGVSMKSDEKAEEHRKEGYKRLHVKEQLFSQVNPRMKDVQVEERVCYGSVVVQLLDGSESPIAELPYGRYTTYMGSSPVGTVRWDNHPKALNALLQCADMSLKLGLEREL